MTTQEQIRLHPARTYFAMAYLLSWLGALIVIAPHFMKGRALTKMDGLMMFPVMILGPCLTSIFLTKKISGRPRLKILGNKMLNTRFGWYSVMLLIPPALVFITLTILEKLAGPDFRPNFFPFGILFGIPAGLLEEVGWTGFALPALRKKYNLLSSGLIIGILWGFWHLPVMDYLGAASPHGKYLLPFALAFIAAMTAMRLLITWLVEHTGSLLLAQCMHIVSTGSLVVLGPPNLSPAQESLWYGAYAIILWMVVCVIYWPLSPKNEKAGEEKETELLLIDSSRS